MPTKYVLKRKYKNYTDPYAKDWYEAIYDPNFLNSNYEKLKQKQAALNAADYVESMYRYNQRKYKAKRDSVESNPNFVGPRTPNGLIPDTIKRGLQFENFDSRLFWPFNDNYPDLPKDYNKYKLGGDKRVKAADGTFWQQTGLNHGDLGFAGIQLLGNIGASLINQNAINKLRFTPIHTTTVAEAPVKFNTTYDINPQVSRLRENLARNRQEIVDNTASSKTAFGRMLHNSWLGIDTYNNLYGNKLNQETSMLNADAQNRQNVFARNAHRLQQNISRDILYNAQGEDNLRNTRTMLTSQNWTNAVNQGVNALANTYNRGQQRLQDANSLLAIMANTPNAMKFFFNEDGTITDEARKLLQRSRDMVGVGSTFKLGGKSSLIRNR